MIFTKSTFISFTIFVFAILVTKADDDPLPEDPVVLLRGYCNELLIGIDGLFNDNKQDYEKAIGILESEKIKNESHDNLVEFLKEPLTINNMLDYNLTIKKNPSWISQNNLRTKKTGDEFDNLKSITVQIQAILNMDKTHTLHEESKKARHLIELLKAIQYGELYELNELNELKKSKELKKLEAPGALNTVELEAPKPPGELFIQWTLLTRSRGLQRLEDVEESRRLQRLKDFKESQYLQELSKKWTESPFIRKIQRFVLITSRLVASISKIEKIIPKRLKDVNHILFDLALQYLLYLKNCPTKYEKPVTQFCEAYITEDQNIFEKIKIEE